MPLRLSARVLAAAGALALAASLSSCGFDYGTDRVYTPAAGINDRDAMVDVLGALVVSAQDGSGTFIASFANNDQEKSATVTGIEGSGDDTAIKATNFSDITIPPGGLVNLAKDGGVELSGDAITSGAFVTLTVDFANGESSEVDVPVLPPCDGYEGLDKSGDGSTAEQNCTIESPEASSSAE